LSHCKQVGWHNAPCHLFENKLIVLLFSFKSLHELFD
jgi:hypothetical protein